MANHKVLFKVFLYSMPPIFAVLVTLLTGILGGFGVERGVPLPWKTGLGCSEPYPLGLLCTPITYNWIAFGLDALFYTVVGYFMLFGYAKYRGGKSASLSPKSDLEEGAHHQLSNGSPPHTTMSDTATKAESTTKSKHNSTRTANASEAKASESLYVPLTFDSVDAA